MATTTPICSCDKTASMLYNGTPMCKECTDVEFSKKEVEFQTMNTNTCKWHLEEKDGYNLEEHDYWETSCDNLFQFNAGGPENNRFKFCPYCGKPIEEVKE